MGLLVLMIACANIAGLVLVRGVSRRGEIAVRLALGATRRRIVRLLVLENLVLAAPGAALGVLLAWRGIPPLVTYAEWLAAPQRLFFNIEVDGLVIAFSALVAAVSALVFGFVPALQSTRVDLVSVINEDASPRGAARGRLRAVLVVAQVAVSLLLLVGAGLAMRTVEAARRADPGFDATQLTSIDRRRQAERLRSHPRPRVLPPAAGCGAGRRRHRVGDPRHASPAGPARHAVAARRDRRLRAGARRRPVVHVQHRRPRLLPHAADSGDGRAGVRGSRRRDGAAGGGRQRDARRAVLGRRGRARSASGSASTTAIWRTVVGVAADVKYSRVNEAPRPYFYLPFFQSYAAEHAAAHPRTGADRDAPRPGARRRRRARRRPADLVGPAVHREHQGRAALLRPGGDDAVRVRRRRHGAGGARHLRSGLVHREAEHARDRHPHGARRLRRRGAARLPRPRPPSGRDRRGARRGRRARPRPAPRARAVRRQRRPTPCRSRARWRSCWPAWQWPRSSRRGARRGPIRCARSRHH